MSPESFCIWLKDFLKSNNSKKDISKIQEQLDLVEFNDRDLTQDLKYPLVFVQTKTSDASNPPKRPNFWTTC
jgi:hypothetical protein